MMIMSQPFIRVWALSLLAVLHCGCLRSHYRMDADQEVYCLIGEKTNHKHWALSDYSIDIDPRSRMYDPNNPDCPPVPTDDPYSHALMHWVDCKNGFPDWHINGSTAYSENPSWLDFLETDENGVLVLDSAGSFQLARLHTPDYQAQFETLYLSALDVSAQRFQFDSQFFGGYSTGYRTAGALAGGPSSQLDATTRGIQGRRFFTTGANLVVNFANAIVWEFSGPNTNSISSTLDFTLIQPLLRNAGRDVVMEGLTQSERTLLGNVRQIERYRRGFFLDIVYGVGAQAGPSRGGGFFNSVGTGTAGNASGFLGLLQSLQRIRNQETNVSSLESSLAQLEAFYDAGRVDFTQVENIRQSLFQSNTQLLRARRTFNDSMDRYKADLGIPPQVPIRLDDPMLDQFRLIDPEINQLQNQITQLQYETGPLLIAIRELIQTKTPWNDDYVKSLQRLSVAVEKNEQLRAIIIETYVANSVEAIEKFELTIPDRISAAKRILERKKRVELLPVTSSEAPLLSSVNDSLFDTENLNQLPTRLTELLNEIVGRLNQNGTTASTALESIKRLVESGDILEQEALEKVIRAEVLSVVPSLFTNLSADVIEVSLIQASARAEAITLIPIEIPATVALEIARVSRRDWMNARASLVDSWRQIEIVANDLESQLDIVFSGDLGTVGANGLDFRAETGTLRGRLEFDAPITRLLERNGYRQVLINYQQSRRRYYQIEDSIAAQLRSLIRQVDESRINFELQRNGLRVAVSRVQADRFELEKPPAAQVQATGPATLGPTTARNLIQSLEALQSTQDDFLNVWVNYEVQRALLDLNMGTMQVDETGMWIDPGALGLEYGYPKVDELPIQCRIPPNPSWLIPAGSDAIFSGQAVELMEPLPAGDGQMNTGDAPDTQPGGTAPAGGEPDGTAPDGTAPDGTGAAQPGEIGPAAADGQRLPGATNGGPIRPLPGADGTSLAPPNGAGRVPGDPTGLNTRQRAVHPSLLPVPQRPSKNQPMTVCNQIVPKLQPVGHEPSSPIQNAIYLTQTPADDNEWINQPRDNRAVPPSRLGGNPRTVFAPRNKGQ